MISQRKPVTNFIRKIDEENQIYAIDSDPGLFKIRNGILMEMGKVVEKTLTLDPDTFRSILLKKQ